MARKIVLTVGSRGDVQPYVALGAGLQANGRQIRAEDGVARAVAVIERALSIAENDHVTHSS